MRSEPQTLAWMSPLPLSTLDWMHLPMMVPISDQFQTQLLLQLRPLLMTKLMLSMRRQWPGSMYLTHQVPYATLWRQPAKFGLSCNALLVTAPVIASFLFCCLHSCVVLTAACVLSWLLVVSCTGAHHIHSWLTPPQPHSPLHCRLFTHLAYLGVSQCG